MNSNSIFAVFEYVNWMPMESIESKRFRKWNVRIDWTGIAHFFFFRYCQTKHSFCWTRNSIEVKELRTFSVLVIFDVFFAFCFVYLVVVVVIHHFCCDSPASVVSFFTCFERRVRSFMRLALTLCSINARRRTQIDVVIFFAVAALIIPSVVWMCARARLIKCGDDRINCESLRSRIPHVQNRVHS